MSGDWLNDIKTGLKKHPAIYKVLIELLSPVMLNKTKDYRIVFPYLKNDPCPVIINLGSGPFKLDDRVINLDISEYQDVSIVADIHKLPFKDSSVDCIINIVVLEHVKDPGAVLKEAYRVLKNDGYVYSVIPFMQGYHASPYDYQRYTIEGIKQLHKDFSLIEGGIYSGPTSGFLWALQEWLATLCSFGSMRLYKLFYLTFMVILWPLKFLDVLLCKYPSSVNIASSFYFLGKK